MLLSLGREEVEAMLADAEIIAVEDEICGHEYRFDAGDPRRAVPARRPHPPLNIDISEEAGVRYLHFGSSWVQGAMRIARPFALELDYTREMMVPLLLHGDDWPRSVLQIGLGAASVTKFLHRHRPQAKLTVVEIEPRVEAAARQFFKLPDDPKRISHPPRRRRRLRGRKRNSATT
jgi:hypothetical protein